MTHKHLDVTTILVCSAGILACCYLLIYELPVEMWRRIPLTLMLLANILILSDTLYTAWRIQRYIDLNKHREISN